MWSIYFVSRAGILWKLEIQCEYLSPQHYSETIQSIRGVCKIQEISFLNKVHLKLNPEELRAWTRMWTEKHLQRRSGGCWLTFLTEWLLSQRWRLSSLHLKQWLHFWGTVLPRSLNHPISCIGGFRRKNKMNVQLQENIGFLEAYANDLEATSFLGVTYNTF